MYRASTSSLPALAYALSLGFVGGAHAQALEDTSAELDAATVGLSRSAIGVSALISQRFSPVANAFALPDAPERAAARPQGLAGGDSSRLKGWSTWGSLVARRTENTFAPEQESANAYTLSLGMDRPVSETITLGVSGTLTRESAATGFGTGTRDASSVYISPYANFKLNDWLSADASLGYGYTNTDRTRPGATGSYDSQTLFGAINLTASKWQGSWLTSGVVGLSGSSTRRSAFTESDRTVNAADTSGVLQARVGGTIGYYTEPMLPYLSAEYIYDIDYDRSTVPGAPNDRDEFRLTLGSHIYGTGAYKNISGGFGITKSFGRDSKEDTSANFSLRVDF